MQGSPENSDIPAAWSRTPDEVLRQHASDAATGLTDAEARKRLARFGSNQLRRAKTRSVWRILFAQLANLMMGLLGIAALLAFLFVDWIEGTAILAVMLINTLIGFITEWKAERSMAELYRLGQVTAHVRRDGHLRELSAAELVPGDIVEIEGGDVITADMRLISASRLQADESTLTGESLPISKHTSPVPAETPLPDRHCMVYKGTAIHRGSAEAVVVATGLKTELGKITALVEETEDTETPLEARLDRLAHRLVFLTLALAAMISLAGVLTGRDFVTMLQTGVALAVATVPEGLPIVATIALARGMWRMAKHKALITRLSAVESLGATGVICVDKTGTITENKMTVARIKMPELELHAEDPRPPSDNANVREAFETAVLCNNAELHDDTAVGDPLEAALLISAQAYGIKRGSLLEAQPETREEAFDTETRLMATFHRTNGEYRVAVKGAPEAVIEHCTQMRVSNCETRPFSPAEKQTWIRHNDRLASQGFRMIALATRKTQTDAINPYQDLVFLGLVALLDPPREDVKAAIARCEDAGIRVILITGDHAATAKYVAQKVGLIRKNDATPIVSGVEISPTDQLDPETRERFLRTTVFARVDPRQKLSLIDLHQRDNKIVAMTGDGVNDAPALKKADIGIAMGLRGTQVAREAADMILKDDAFGTIVVAVEQGRIIFDNIRKFVLYLLSCNVSEVAIVAIAILAGAPLPLLPLQILFLNLVTDVFPALALGVGPGDPEIMNRSPRPADEEVLSRSHWFSIGWYGILMTASVLGAFFLSLRVYGLGETSSVTIAFMTLALAQVWHVFNMRNLNSGILVNDITRNAWVWMAILICIALLAVAVFVEPLAKILNLNTPSPFGWLLILIFSLAPLLAGQAGILWSRGSVKKHSRDHG